MSFIAHYRSKLWHAFYCEAFAVGIHGERLKQQQPASATSRFSEFQSAKALPAQHMAAVPQGQQPPPSPCRRMEHHSKARRHLWHSWLHHHARLRQGRLLHARHLHAWLRHPWLHHTGLWDPLLHWLLHRRPCGDGQCSKTSHAAGAHHRRNVVRHIVIWRALVLLLLLLFLGRLFVECIDPACVFSKYLDEERHSKIEHVLAPCKLETNIRIDELIAGEEACGEALFHVFFNKVPQQAFSQLLIATVTGSLHGIPVHLIKFGEINGLLVSLVLLVHQCGDPSHFNKFMLLQLLSKSNLVNVVE